MKLILVRNGNFYLYILPSAPRNFPPNMKKSKNQFILLAVLIAVSLLSFTVTDRLEKRKAIMASSVADWERAKAYTLEYLNASTDEVITFKPTPDMRSFGQHMLHIAEPNYGMSSAAAGKTSPVPFGSLEKSAISFATAIT